MTGSMKLAALFAGAVLVFAQGIGSAEAGHKHKDKGYDGDRGKASYGQMAYKNGKAWGKRGKLHYQSYDERDDWRRDRILEKRKKEHRKGAKAAHLKRAKQQDGFDEQGDWRRDRILEKRKEEYRKRYRQAYLEKHGGKNPKFDHDDDDVFFGKKHKKSVNVWRDDDGRRGRVVSNEFAWRRAPSGADLGSLSCGTSKSVSVVNGRKAKIGRQVCRDVDGQVFAVAGTEHVIKYMK